MSTPQQPRGGRGVTFKAGMEPERVQRGNGSQTASDRFLAAIPSTFRGLSDTALPPRETNGVRRWLNGTGQVLWLGGESFRGKSSTTWLVVVRYAIDNGMTWAHVQADDYIRARRGTQTPEEAALIRKCETVNILVLDEWALDKPTEATLQSLRHLMTVRGTRRTVITGNGAAGVDETLRAILGPYGAAARALHSRIAAFNDEVPGPALYVYYDPSLPRLDPPRPVL